MKENNMKKDEINDELRPEYDLTKLKGGIKGKYVERYREETNVVVLEPEVARVFPSSAAVNAALRGLINNKEDRTGR